MHYVNVKRCLSRTSDVVWTLRSLYGKWPGSEPWLWHSLGIFSLFSYYTSVYEICRKYVLDINEGNWIIRIPQCTVWAKYCKTNADSSDMQNEVYLKGNITFVCAHTANGSFHALNTLYGTYVAWKFWFTNEISKRRLKKCITNEEEWTWSCVLHCNVTVAAWRCENTRDVGAAL